jgi:hypothetical protein
VANYGDLGVALPKDWNRRAQNDQAFIMNTIGHTEGKSDVWLTEEPDQEHQFAWVDVRHRDEVAMNQSRGYRFVKRADGWEKIDLWEWDAEDFLIRADGQRLMARKKELFVADMKARKEQRERVMNTNKDDEAVAKLAAKLGISISGDDGKPVRRRVSGLRG